MYFFITRSWLSNGVLCLQVTPENIQIQILPDGRLTGDALISFMTRSEAERAVATRSKQTMGHCIIELFLAWFEMVKYAMPTFTI